jgi:hypothetical protein
MVGVWIEPVIAQLMMIFAIGPFLPTQAFTGVPAAFIPA